MPKNQVNDPITDQEIAFAHLVLSGTMTDRAAAEAAGLNPDTAAYTKAKPRVHAYMLEHRAAVHERLVEQETEDLRRLNVAREQVLTRLWEIANLSPEVTRGSVTAQVKALTMIVAIEGLIPDRHTARRAVYSEEKSAPLPKAEVYKAAWLREQEAKTTVPQPSPDLLRDEQELGVPDLPPGAAADAPPPPGIPPSPVPRPVFGPNESAFANRLNELATTPSASHVPLFARDTRKAFSTEKNRFGRRR
jgi:hypothetical protein